MLNLVINIVLPKGLRLQNGAVLEQDITLSVIGSISPFYCSVEQVQLEGGIYLKKLAELTIAKKIYEVSKDADSFSYNRPRVPNIPYDVDNPAWRQYMIWVNGRQNWVNAIAAYQLVLNIYELSGARGSHTLGNFSVQKQSIMRDEGMPKKISDLKDGAQEWLITIKSGGDIGPGGHIRGRMAAKGVYSGTDATPGRLWLTTGMGANQHTFPGPGDKPVKFNSRPYFGWRVGATMGSYLAVWGAPSTSFFI